MNKNLYIYILLLIFSFLTLFISFKSDNNTIFIFLVIIITYSKAYLISDYFMELKSVKIKYRIIPIFYFTTVLGIILLAYTLPL